MTSYQRRKREIEELKEKLDASQELAYSLALEIKHYFLALDRGQENHADQCKRAVAKRIDIAAPVLCEAEREVLGLPQKFFK